VLAHNGLVKIDPGGARPARDCLGRFDDGRAAAWAGATLAACPYRDPSLAAAWACGFRVGQVEMCKAGPLFNREGRHAREA
jgi:ribosome modulation factor